MPIITFIDPKGTEHIVDAISGANLMQAALIYDIEGIVAECRGSCACGTCHCYIDETFLDKLPPVRPGETEMLECSLDVRANSRLSCQVIITDAMDGMVVRLPKNQF